MAHFAQLDANNVVIQVIVVNNAVVEDLPFPESEPLGVAFCQSLFGAETNWVQTSYNGSFRKNYAGVGGSFDAVKNAFIPFKPFPSWVLNEDTCTWQAPSPRPNDTDLYEWNEETLSWDKVNV